METVTVTTKQQFLATRPEVLEMVEEFEKAIANGYLTTDPVNGWGEHIRVDVDVPEWMRPIIEGIYEDAGWTVSFKFMNRVMLLI